MQAVNDERKLIRDLAIQVADIANGDDNKAICKRWRDVNALRKGDRAPVWCKPVGCWEEILPSDDIVCTDPSLRPLELHFRRVLAKHDINDDSPLEPCFTVNASFDVDPPNQWGVDVGKHESNTEGGAWAYDPPLKTEADFDKLVMPTYTYNQAATRENVQRMEELLGDIMPVKLVTAGFEIATLCSPAANLRGLEQMMMDVIVEPHLMHRLMTYLRDAKHAELDTVEQSGILTPNNTAPMICSDPIGVATEGKYTLANCWCDANSQEFDQVSPDMWQEFCLDYQKPIFERFGLVLYGCCENLTAKIDGVLSIPNLRIFVCSAWTDLDVVLSKIETDYCIMWRQKASDIVFPDDTASIRRHLEEGAKRLQGRRYQIVLRELQTLNGHTNRLHEWADIAKEMAAKYS